MMQGGGFHVCIPYCGFCKPPKPMPVICPDCTKFFEVEEGVPQVCDVCGATLPRPVPPTPIMCSIIDKICMNPCGRGALPEDEVGKAKQCVYHTEAPEGFSLSS